MKAPIIVLVVMLALPGTAFGARVTRVGDTLVYTADAGEVNDVVVTFDRGSDRPPSLVRDTGVAVLVADNGCQATTDPQVVQCGTLISRAVVGLADGELWFRSSDGGRE